MSDLFRKKIEQLEEKLNRALAQRDEARAQREQHKAWNAGIIEQRDLLGVERDALCAERDSLRTDRENLLAERAKLRVERDGMQAEILVRQGESLPPPPVRLVTVPPGNTWPPPEPPHFFADSLAVWHKRPVFIDDERFRRAYLRGMNSGHHICRPKGSTVDLHIEWRIHVVLWAAEHGAMLEGDFVECGVNTGMQSLAICDYLDFNSLSKRFWLFDTYRGLPMEQLSPEETKLGTGDHYQDWYSECYELAKANFAPWPQAKLVRGLVPETLTSVEIDKVAYLSIDMNIAYPELEALKYFWPKLVPGAMVVLDDYGWLPHVSQKEAIDEFAAAVGVSIAHLPTGQGLIIKPQSAETVRIPSPSASSQSSAVSPLRVVHLTFPKCGSQWVRDVLTAPEIAAHSGFPLHPSSGSLLLMDWPEQPSATFMGPIYDVSHDHWMAHGKSADKAVVVLRDPRDLAVSLVYSVCFSHAADPYIDMLRQLLLPMDMRSRMFWAMDQLLLGKSKALDSWAGRQTTEREYIARYETLVADPLGEFSRIIAFLGWPVPETVLAPVVQRLSFAQRSGRESGKEDVFSHYRKGVAGDWRRHFDKGLGQTWESVFPGQLRRLGYETTDTWFEELPEKVEAEELPQ